jgi:hypothetical protein
MMTTTPTTDERIATRRATLTKARAVRKDELDLDRTLTMRQVNTYVAETTILDKQIAAFNTTVEKWAALPTLDADNKWFKFLTTSRKTIDAEILAMPPRIRNEKELEQQQRLVFSMRFIDFGDAANRLPAPIIDLSSTRVGELMKAAGFDVAGQALRGPNGWQGSLPEVEKRIKELTKQRTEAQAALDALLITDEERTAQEAESAELAAAFNAMHCKYIDGGYVGYTDGDVLPVSEMTPLQKRAIERMDTLEREYRQSVVERQSAHG